MIEHCKTNFEVAGLNFQQVDSAKADTFNEENKERFSMVTSFSCLHWVPDQPITLEMFNKVLKPGGRFLLVIASTQNKKLNILRREYEKMKKEQEWEEVLRPTRWMHFKTAHVNKAWMSHDYIELSDYVGLLEAKGFKVDGAKDVPLNYLFDKDFKKNFFKSTLLTSFPELQGEARKSFFNEYIKRVNKDTVIDEGGFSETHVDGIQVFGEKISSV